MDMFGEVMSSVAEDAEFLGEFMLAYLVSMLMSSLFSIAVYVLQSLGFYSIAKRRGIHNPWLAWIPVANMWILGSIADQFQYVAKGKVKNRRKTLLGLQIGMCVCGILIFAVVAAMGVFSAEMLVSGMNTDMQMVAGGMNTGMEMVGPVLLIVVLYLALAVISVVLTVFQYIACYDLYASCSPDNAVIFLVLSIFINITMPIFIFAIRNKDGGMPPRRVQTPAPEPEPEAEAAYPELSEPNE